MEGASQAAKQIACNVWDAEENFIEEVEDEVGDLMMSSEADAEALGDEEGDEEGEVEAQTVKSVRSEKQKMAVSEGPRAMS